MAHGEHGPEHSSDILDAILDKVSESPTRTETTHTLFRAKALEQLDVAAEIDNQLPLVPRRSWLLLVGAGCIVVGFILWTALTPSVRSVPAMGRALAPSGIVQVVSPATGVVDSLTVIAGAAVAADAEVGAVLASGASTPVSTRAAGTVWELLHSVGSGVVVGQPIVTLLPDGSDVSALMVLDEEDALSVRPGMQVTSGGSVIGAVTVVEPPVPAATAEARTGITSPPNTNVVIVQVALTSPARPGQKVDGTVILSTESLLQRLVSR